MSKAQLKAFHGDPAIKAKYLNRVRMHREADQLIKGTYWEDGKGCAVGCTIHSDNHGAYETELGIPRKLARLEDGIFEGLPNGKALAWPEQFLDAIPVGADLSLVGDKFLHWLLIDPAHGVIRHAKTDRTKQAIMTVAAVYERRLAGESVSDKEWRTAAAAAAAAAAYAAYAAAAYAAYAAAAYAAYAAYAAAAARAQSRILQSEKLIQLLQTA